MPKPHARNDPREHELGNQEMLKKMLRSNIRWVLAIGLVLFPHASPWANDDKIFCDQAKKMFGEISQQLPMRIDSASEMTSITVLHLSRHCYVTFRYSLDIRLLYSELSKEFGDKMPMTESEYIQTWKGDGVRQEFTQYLLSQLPNENREMASFPFASVRLVYSFLPYWIEPLTVDVK